MNVIQEFINTKKKENTKLYYELALNKYFDCISADPNKYFKTKRDYEADVEKFVKTLERYAPITQKNYTSVIKRFFYINDIEFKPSFWELKVKDQIERGACALTLDRKPTRQELKKILSYGDLKAKALFTLSATSGLRIGTLLQLTPEDIDLESIPGLITIRSTIVKGSRRSRWAFMSDEAKQLLQEWITPNKNGISERDKYLQETQEQMKGILKTPMNDKLLFPIKSSAARRLWTRLIKKAELNKKYSETDRYELHIYSLRKFFMSNLKVEVPEVLVEGWVGHRKYLSEAYSRYSLEEQKQFYLKGMHLLNIFESTPDLSGVRVQLDEKDKQMKEMQDMIQEMKAQILELRLEKIEKLSGIKKK